ncbi:MAG: homoprotocatechuate degradation operon regulator, HpaR [Roseibaca calidilacus]|uniref:Homoprotocatechuate degradation operon regulator, HpaR n=1 Tax=Roseibaca calidilacus TaxID=1666912 RepID=A0A0P7WWM8_9RHOB|nr:homoprotocatechuate degradation operon regulator HpaR [Roseibaca calidilacus]KPP95676.1 MAG: homoprotocatechuate degradation operon regulator, HpaR [Roseibaca calidilacus]CUX81902.1 homoprotocatechuate degradation operon regulator, HpaR [Roseibaca calidilacus]
MSDRKATELRRYEKSLPISLLRTREATTRYFKPFIDQRDLTMPQWRVLRALAEEEGLDARTLSERCVILPPSLTRIFRSLTQRGLISQVDCSDARRHRVMLTETGRALFEAVMEESEPHYQRLAAAFGAERLDSLMNLLSELRDTVETLNAEDARDIAEPRRKLAAGR